VTELTFLGTGNFLAPPGRYWNSFVLDDNVLVEPSPTALPHLRRCGHSVGAIEVVVISHFHADHCFGWPFLLEALTEAEPDPGSRAQDGRTVHVVGPPGLEAQLAHMLAVGAVRSVLDVARTRLDLRFVEVDETWQQAGPLRFRAVEVEHVPYLQCFGFLFDRGRLTVAYSGDVRPCDGLHELARWSDVLVLECNGAHEGPRTHMNEADVRELHEAHPGVHLVLTHLGEQVDTTSMPGVTIPDDFDRLTI
jgi:ribonuclease BN (tRNA processing enzyme)